jgi:methyltransferase (TIGR00027 family)
MRDDTPSRTARWVAAARGLGHLLEDSVRLADDPYGLLFSSSRLARLINRDHGARGAALARMPVLATWLVHMQIRTYLIDDAVRAFAAAGGRQVVVLGAGYDTRALRLPELAGAAVFEVDHPATQDHKRAVLQHNAPRSPSHYLAWDFESQPLDDLPGALADAGLDRAAPSLTIWEGVTMYLTEPAIDASLRAIASWSAAGSELALTYVPRSDFKRSLPMRAVRAVAARLGEPFKIGWMPDELAGYLETRGFALVRDVSIAEAARELLPRDLAAHAVRDTSHTALARVIS